MTNTQKDTAETPVPVYMTREERRLLRLRAAEKETSMSKLLRTLVRRELGLGDEEA